MNEENDWNLFDEWEKVMKEIEDERNELGGKIYINCKDAFKNCTTIYSKKKKIYNVLLLEKYNDIGNIISVRPIKVKEINNMEDSRELIEYAKECMNNTSEKERYYIVSCEEL